MNTKTGFNLEQFSQIMGYKLRTTQVRLYRYFMPVFDSYKVSPIEYAVLSAIQENPGTYQKMVAGALAIEPPALVAILDSLADANYIERRVSRKDRRARALHLTSAGQKQYARMSAEINRLDANIRNLFTSQEFAEFSGYIDRMNDFFKQQGY